MADPTFIIKIEDDGGVAFEQQPSTPPGQAPQQQPSSPPTTSSPAPPPPPAQPVTAAPATPVAPAPPAVRDPVADAKRQLENEAHAARVEEEKNKLSPPTVPVAASGKTARPRGAEAAEQAEEAKAKQIADVQAAGRVAQAAGVEGAGAAAAAVAGPAAAVMVVAQKVKQISDTVKEKPNDIFAMIGSTGMAGEIIEKMATKIGDLGRLPGVAAERVGNVATQAAGNQNAKAVGEVADGMISLAKEIPLVGQAFSILPESASKVVRSFNTVVDAFIDRGREIKQYSGATAQSYALTDVKSLMADIREAQRLGPGTARLNDAQTELTIMLRDLLLPIKEILIGKGVTLLEAIVQFLNDAEYEYDILAAKLDFIYEDIKRITHNSKKTLEELQEETAKKFQEAFDASLDRQRERGEKLDPDVLGKWLDMLDAVDHFPNRNQRRDPMAGDERLGIPAVLDR